MVSGRLALKCPWEKGDRDEVMNGGGHVGSRMRTAVSSLGRPHSVLGNREGKMIQIPSTNCSTQVKNISDLTFFIFKKFFFRQRQAISVNPKPAWTTKQVPGQPE